MARRRVSEFMTSKVVTLRPDMTVRQAEEVLAHHGIGGAPVVDAAGRVVGVVSQRDLVRIEAEPATAGGIGEFFTDIDDYRDLAQVPVEQSTTLIEKLMTEGVLSVTPETDVAVAAKTMRKHRIHRLLVTRDDVLLGMLSSLDLLQALEQACASRSRRATQKKPARERGRPPSPG